MIIDHGISSVTRLFLCHTILLLPFFSYAQTGTNSFEVYGFILTDGGYNFNTIDPDWYDVMRPTKLPKYADQYAPPGNFFFSVRQTRIGIKSSRMTKLGELKTQFDFDFFGVGKDVGQTTIHLVNVYGQLGKFLVGQTPSVFMDPDVFPVTLDYWGPSSRIFFLNIQFRFTPINTERERLAMSLERPGATADNPDYSNSVDIQDVKPRLPLPNLAAHYRRDWEWGHVQLSGLAKYLEWKDMTDTTVYNLSGSDLGWGLNLSTVFHAGYHLAFKMQGSYGEGYENYIADTSPDLALASNPGNVSNPAEGTALPAWGFFGYAEVMWTSSLRSSVGYSMLTIQNSDLQSPDAFRRGEYFSINSRWYPLENVMFGLEYQFGRRHNFADGFSSIAHKIQCSFKYNFSHLMEWSKVSE